METTSFSILLLGIACIIAAVLGGGLKAFGIEIPIIQKRSQRYFLAGVGILLAGIAIVGPLPFRFAPPSPPVISRFDAQPPEIESGQQTMLSWDVLGAKTIRISGIKGVQSAPSGSTLAAPTISGRMSYRLTASNSSGEVTRTVTVVVRPPALPIVRRFDAQPHDIESGQQSVLSWEVRGAETVTISGVKGAQPGAGSAIVAPSHTTTYILTASNSSGTAPPRPFVVRVHQPPPAQQPPSILPFAVTRLAVRMDVRDPSAPCLVTITGAITTNGPGEVTYRWGRYVGSSPKPKGSGMWYGTPANLSFAAAGTHTISFLLNVDSLTGYHVLEVLKPNPTASNKAPFFACAPAPGSGTDARLIGRWTNAKIPENPDFRSNKLVGVGVTRVEIRSDGNDLSIHMWVNCTPTDCDRGEQKVSVKEIRSDGSLVIRWTYTAMPGYVTTQELVVLDDGRLKMEDLDTKRVEYFIKMS